MRWFFLLLPFAFLTGCITPERYTETVYPPTDYRQVEVVHLNQLQRPYEIIGECRGDAVFQNAMDLKKMAAKMGANAMSIPEHHDHGLLTSQAIRWKN